MLSRRANVEDLRGLPIDEPIDRPYMSEYDPDRMLRTVYGPEFGGGYRHTYQYRHGHLANLERATHTPPPPIDIRQGIYPERFAKPPTAYGAMYPVGYGFRPSSGMHDTGYGMY